MASRCHRSCSATARTTCSSSWRPPSSGPGVPQWCRSTPSRSIRRRPKPPVRQPFNVNSIALAAASAALDDMEFVARSYAENLRGMRQLEEGAHKLGLDFIPSHGNFLALRVGKAAEIFKRLLRRGVIVRPVGGAYHLPEHLRG